MEQSKKILGMDIVVFGKSEKCVTNVKKKGLLSDKNQGILELKTGDFLLIYFLSC